MPSASQNTNLLVDIFTRNSTPILIGVSHVQHVRCSSNDVFWRLQTNSALAAYYRAPRADIDATALMAEIRGMDGSDGGVSASSWCNWSDDPGILDTLLGEFRGAGAGGFDTNSDAGGVKGGEGSKGGDGEIAEEDDSERSAVHMHLSEV